MKKLTLGMALMIALMMTFTACSSDTAEPSSEAAPADSSASSDVAAEPGEIAQDLTVCIGPTPETMDPTLNSASDAGSMIIHVFEGLMTYEEDGSFGYGQAESHTVSEDGLTYTFKLREGLMWSDGTPLTANDFVYSWKRGVDPATAAPYAELFKYIKGYDEAIAGDVDALAVTAIDDLTLEVVLNTPTGFFEALVAFPTYMPLNQATIDANGESWAIDPTTYISNGAFMMTEYVPDQHIVMTKNPNYHDADSITLDTLTFALMADENAAFSAYQSGDLLALKSIPSNEVASLLDDPEFALDPLIGTYYLNFNHNVEGLNNVLVREAMALAIDRQYISDVVLGGTYGAATNFVGPGFPDPAGGEFHEITQYYALDTFEADLERAKELMTEAGYPNGEGLEIFEYKTNPDGYHVQVAEYLQAAWAEIGVKIEIKTEEWGTFTASRRNDEFDIARNGWIGDYVDPSTMLDLMISTNGNNDGGYSNPEYDAIMAEVASEPDQTIRFEKMHEAEAMLVEDTALIPIAYYADFYLYSEDMQGAWHNPKGYFFFHEAEIVA